MAFSLNGVLTCLPFYLWMGGEVFFVYQVNYMTLSWSICKLRLCEPLGHVLHTSEIMHENLNHKKLLILFHYQTTAACASVAGPAYCSGAPVALWLTLTCFPS